MSDVINAKKKLIEEIDKKIEEAGNLPEDKEKTTEFLTQFNQFIDSLQRKENCEVEIEKVETSEISDDEDEDLAELNRLRVKRGLPKRKKKIYETIKTNVA